MNGADFARVLAHAPPGPVGVAVSGGGDSVALLLRMQAWGEATGRGIAAVTVDHGLRAESAVEAAGVAAMCARLGVSHDIVCWTGWNGRGNLQQAARLARRIRIGGWARARGIAAVTLGHTLDDQAETFLMRLARGSGVDGLAGMAPVVQAEGILWLRPLLAVARADLREALTRAGESWVEDPGNADPAFARVRARAALGPLQALGLSAARLAETAARMRVARAALEAQTGDLARACLSAGRAGDLTLDPGVWRVAAQELRLRVLAGALCWVSGAQYRPRLARLETLARAIEGGEVGAGLTLHGCVLRTAKRDVVLRREVARVAPPVDLDAGVWDGRWAVRVASPQAGARSIGALGAAGLAQMGDWRASGLAREALMATPGLWDGERLVAGPVVSPGGGVEVRRISALTPPWEFTLLR